MTPHKYKEGPRGDMGKKGRSHFPGGKRGRMDSVFVKRHFNDRRANRDKNGTAAPGSRCGKERGKNTAVRIAVNLKESSSTRLRGC